MDPLNPDPQPDPAANELAANEPAPTGEPGTPPQQAAAAGVTAPAQAQQESAFPVRWQTGFVTRHAKAAEAQPWLGMGTIGDVTLGLGTAAEQVSRDVYGVADFLLGGALPNLSDERILWEPRTRLGAFAPGIYEAVGIPFMGGAFGLAKSVEGVASAARMLLPRGLQAATLNVVRNHRFLTAMGEGATIDFIMGEHGPALSALIQGLDPEAQIPVISWLAHPEDSGLANRAKTVLEGVGVGYLFRLLSSGYSAYKQNKVVRYGEALASKREQAAARSAKRPTTEEGQPIPPTEEVGSPLTPIPKEEAPFAKPPENIPGLGPDPVATPELVKASREAKSAESAATAMDSPAVMDAARQVLSEETMAAINEPSALGIKLPRELAGAKPRFNIGDQSYIPQFASDIDRALFITSQKKKSARDADYRSWLKSVGFTDEAIDANGQQVRSNLKEMLQSGTINEGPFMVNPIVERPAAKTAPAAVPNVTITEEPTAAATPAPGIGVPTVAAAMTPELRKGAAVSVYQDGKSRSINFASDVDRALYQLAEGEGKVASKDAGLYRDWLQSHGFTDATIASGSQDVAAAVNAAVAGVGQGGGTGKSVMVPATVASPAIAERLRIERSGAEFRKAKASGEAALAQKETPAAAPAFTPGAEPEPPAWLADTNITITKRKDAGVTLETPKQVNVLVNDPGDRALLALSRRDVTPEQKAEAKQYLVSLGMKEEAIPAIVRKARDIMVEKMDNDEGPYTFDLNLRDKIRGMAEKGAKPVTSTGTVEEATPVSAETLRKAGEQRGIGGMVDTLSEAWRGKLPEETIQTVGNILHRVGEKYFGDVGFAVQPSEELHPSAKVLGSYEHVAAANGLNGLVRLSSMSFIRGAGTTFRTLLHEYAHSLERFFTPEDHLTIQQEFERAKRANPTAPDYKYTDPTEWWAETFVDRAKQLQDRGTFDERTSLGSKLTGFAKDMWYAASDFFHDLMGQNKETVAMVDRFLQGGDREAAGMEPTAGLEARRGVSFMLDPERQKDIGEQIQAWMDVAAKLRGKEGMLKKSPSDLLGSDIVSPGTFTKKGDTNLRWIEGPKELWPYMRAADRAADFLPGGSNVGKVTFEEFQRRDLRGLAEMAGVKDYNYWIHQMGGTLKEIMTNWGTTLRVKRSIMVSHAQHAMEVARDYFTGPKTDRNLLMAFQGIDTLRYMAKDVREATSEMMRNAVAQKKGTVPLRSDQLEALVGSAQRRRSMLPTEGETPGGPTQAPQMDPEMLHYLQTLSDRFTPAELMDAGSVADAISRLGGRDKLETLLSEASRILDMRLTEVDRVKLLTDMGDIAAAPTTWQMAADWFRTLILTGPRTVATVFGSEGAYVPFQFAEHWIGGTVGRIYAGLVKKDPALAKQYAKMAQTAQRGMFAILDRDSLKDAVRGAWATFQKARKGEPIDPNLSGFAGEVQRTRGMSEDALDSWRQGQQAYFQPGSFGYNFYSEGNPLYAGFRYIMTQAGGNIGGVNVTGGGLGGLVRTAGTAPLSAIDSFIKTTVIRANVRAMLKEQAVMWHDGDLPAQNSFVSRRMTALFQDGQLVTLQRLEQEGIADAMSKGLTGDKLEAAATQHVRDFMAANPDYQYISDFVNKRANEAAATLPLEYGSIGYGVRNFVEEHGWPAMLIPFVRSSWSLLRTAGQHFDYLGAAKAWSLSRLPDRAKALESANHEITSALLSQDPRMVSLAYGKLSAGLMLATSVFELASQMNDDGKPFMTGALAKDPGLRQQQEAAGYQEYSLNIPGYGAMGYARFDPFASLLGTIADLATYGSMADKAGRDFGRDVVGSIITAFAHNFQNKSYLYGLVNFIDAANSGNVDSLSRLFNNTAASFVIPNFVTQTSGALETTDTGAALQREIRGMGDMFLSKTAYATGLPPKRNVLGEPVKKQQYVDNGWIVPIPYREISTDPVMREMSALRHGFHEIDPKRGALDLRDVRDTHGRSAYDRWGELSSTVQDENTGLNLRDSLQKLIGSDEYKAMELDSSQGLDSPRISAINAILARYRNTAFRNLVNENTVVANNEFQYQAAKVAKQPSLLHFAGGP